MKALYDAHNHLQDARLDPWRDELLERMPACGVAEIVVNGTRESDWPLVADLARHHSWIRPSFGLHPWNVKERSDEWREDLELHIEMFPTGGIGEIGLDRWIRDPDMEAQVECFRWQMDLATERDRPVSIHCLRAFGLLDEELHSGSVPDRGFLLHSYGGPAEMIPRWVDLGAYFSISPHFAFDRKERHRENFRLIPKDRLLVETDAPDMAPPEASNPHPMSAEEPLNHPCNIEFSYALLAETLEMDAKQLATVVAENHSRFFGV